MLTWNCSFLTLKGKTWKQSAKVVFSMVTFLCPYAVESCSTWNIKRPTIVRTTFLTALMCWGGEWLGLANLWPTRVKYFWPPGFSFVHNCRILELLYECFLSLVVGIGHLQNFLAGIHVPSNTESRLRKAKEIVDCDEIHESVPNVTPVFKVHPQVKKNLCASNRRAR